MKKVNACVLSLGVLLMVISGVVFAGEAAPAAQNGTVSSLTATPDVISVHEAIDVYGPNGPNEPGGICGPAEGPGGPGGSGGQGGGGGGLGDFENPLILVLGIVIVMALLI